MGRVLPGPWVVLGGSRFREAWIRGMLDGSIDLSGFGLESAQDLVGSIGLGLKL